MSPPDQCMLNGSLIYSNESDLSTVTTSFSVLLLVSVELKLSSSRLSPSASGSNTGGYTVAVGAAVDGGNVAVANSTGGGEVVPPTAVGRSGADAVPAGAQPEMDKLRIKKKIPAVWSFIFMVFLYGRTRRFPVRFVNERV